MAEMNGMDELMQIIEEEAAAGGSDEVAHLRALQLHYRLASQLTRVRVLRGLKQTELAVLSHISQPEISRIESGRANPNESTLQAILVSLDAEMGIFLKGSLVPV